VRSDDPQALDQVKDYLPPGWKQTDKRVVDRLYSLIAGGPGRRADIRRFSILFRDAERIARSREIEDVLESLESDLQRYVAEMAHHRVFVHAGVVGWQGKAIVIPGRSFTGKTTLVAELVRAGATYYSDEYAVFDLRGRVHPYARPLAVRENGTTRQTRYEVERLGGVAGVRPLQVGLVVLSEYKAGSRWRPRHLSAGQGALALLNNTVSIRRQPEEALAALQEIVTRAPVIKGVRGEAGSMVDSLLEEIRSQKPEGDRG
jgi:hypothetical protein